MLGREGIEKTCGQTFSERFNIHRTRRNFPSDGIDNFNAMALVGVSIVDRTVKALMASESEQDRWLTLIRFCIQMNCKVSPPILSPVG